ncbi:MAG: CBS domain-containing protein [Halobaculum sp.]
MNVADAMTPRGELVTVRLPGGRADALRHLQEQGFSSVPVETDDEEPVYRGLVSRRELIHNPDEDQLALLLREVESVSPDTSLRAAVARMRDGERRLPVVADGRLEGIVTVTDAIRAVARGDVPTDAACEAVATDRVTTVFTETPLVVADRQLGLARESYAVCLDRDSEMAGMLTETDIVSVARIVEGEDQIGDSMADQDEEYKWESVKGVGGRYLPTRNVEIPSEPVAEFMTRDVERVIGGRSVQEAARAMLRADVEQLPLMDGGELVGIVRDTDLLEAITDG